MAARTPVAPKRRGRGGLRILIALVVVVVLVVAGIVTLGVLASADTTVGAVLTTFVPDTSVAHSGGGFSSAASGTFVQPGDAVKGRTLNSVQKLVGGATFQVVGNTTTASVRGTLFEVLVNGDGTVVIKLFIGGLDVDGKGGHVHLTEGQQVTVDANGTIGQPGPITPDPNDPFSQEVAAMLQVETQTTPGTEQDFTGGLLHNGQVQSFNYAFAAPPSGGSDFKAALAYPGSLMELRITDPVNHVYTRTGPSPIVITIPDPPGGIFKLEVIGISGSDVKINIVGDTTGGAIINGSATYNGIGLAGTLLLYAHGGNIGVIPLAASAFGISIPPMQAGQQIASALGQDPSNISLGFHVERLFTCQNVLMIEGRTA